MLGEAPVRKLLRATLDKNVLGAALDEKLCLERHQLRKCWVSGKIKICMERRYIKSYAWQGAR